MGTSKLVLSDFPEGCEDEAQATLVTHPCSSSKSVSLEDVSSDVPAGNTGPKENLITTSHMLAIIPT